jgi:predicted membrane channel-forming protein YqfA (hemolysin III family)
MLKNILFLIACVILAVLTWGAFQVFGKYTFLIMLVITIAGLLAKAGKAKFSKKPGGH